MIDLPILTSILGVDVRLEVQVPDTEMTSTFLKISNIKDKPWLELLFDFSYSNPGTNEEMLLLTCQIFEIYDGRKRTDKPITQKLLINNDDGEFDQFAKLRLDVTEQMQQVVNAFFNAFGNPFFKNAINVFSSMQKYLKEVGVPNIFGTRIYSFIPSNLSNLRDEWLSEFVEPLIFEATPNILGVDINILSQKAGEEIEFCIVRESDGSVVLNWVANLLLQIILLPGRYIIKGRYINKFLLLDQNGLIPIEGRSVIYEVS